MNISDQDWTEYMRNVRAMMAARFAQEDIENYKPPCPYCNGLGVVRYNVPVGHPKFGKLFACDHPDCIKGREARERQEQAGYMRARLPEEYRALTFETWDALPEYFRDLKYVARAACLSFAEHPQHFVSLPILNEIAAPGVQYEKFCELLKADPDAMPRNNVVLYGAPGVGKTGLVAAAMNLIRERGGMVRYTRAMAMFQELYASQKDDSPEQYVEALKGFQFFEGVLVIDEVNIEDYTPARKQWMQEVIRERLGARLPTLMTCNLSRDQFESAWGTWTFSVLHSKAWWVQVKGRNMRPINMTLADPKRTKPK